MGSRVWLLLALPLALTACGSSTSNAPGSPGVTAGKQPAGGPTATGAGGAGGSSGQHVAEGSAPIPKGGLEACTAAWTPTCKMLLTCDPSLSASLFADQADCVAKMASACAASIYVPGGLAIADEQACAQSLTFANCGDFWRFWFVGDLFPACAKAGALDTGAACTTGAQCKSGFCARAADELCGSCAARASEGAQCGATTPCEVGLVCAGTCTKPGEAGAACGETAACQPWLRCLDGFCTTPRADGDPCDPASPVLQCDVDHFCNLKTKTCGSLTVVGAGSPCGVLDDGSYAGCSVGAVCKLDGGPHGTCVTAPTAGQACNEKDVFLFGLGPCAYPANCVGGTCVVGDTTICH